jgi:predicted enzyme related to lactoylglutathione lyase
MVSSHSKSAILQCKKASHPPITLRTDLTASNLSLRQGESTLVKIKLVSLPVNDPIEAFKFYTEVLGFIEVMYVPDAYLAIVASPEQPDGTGLLLEPNNNPITSTFQEGVYKAGLPIIVFGVDDVQQEYQRLRERGVVFTQEPTIEEWGTTAVFDDTCGNLIQLHQD